MELMDVDGTYVHFDTCSWKIIPTSIEPHDTPNNNEKDNHKESRLSVGDKSSSNSNDDELCAICLDKTIYSKLIPCRHCVLCEDCAAVVLGRNSSCPVCCSPISHYEIGSFKLNYENPNKETTS